MLFQDKSLVCKECSQQFVFTAKEQDFYAQKNLTYEPKRCKLCRSLKKANQRNNKNYSRPLFDAVCAKCGRNTQVPFEPVPGRSIYPVRNGVWSHDISNGVYCKQCYQLIKR